MRYKTRHHQPIVISQNMENSDIARMKFELTGYLTVQFADDLGGDTVTFHPDDFKLEGGGYYTSEDEMGYSANLQATQNNEGGQLLSLKLSCHVTQLHKIEWQYGFDGEVTDDQLSYIFEPVTN